MTDFPFSDPPGTEGLLPVVTLGGSSAYYAVGGIDPTTTLGGREVVSSSGGITSTPSISGAWAIRGHGGVTATASLGGAILAKGIVVVPLLGGSFKIVRQESVSVDNDYYLSGVRATMPMIVKSLTAVSLAQVADLNNGDAFIVAPGFSGGPGDPFYDAGAVPGSVGYYKRPGFAADVVFRDPEDWEIVYSMTDGKLYRYETNRDTQAQSWKRYRSMPQRALDGQQAFGTFDPDRVYDYVATIIGGYLGQLQYDARISRQIRDPDLVPRTYLPVALENIGASIDPSVGALGDASDEQTQRYYLATTPTLNKHAGDHLSVTGRLKVLGYVGYATVRWSKVTWPSLMVEAAAMGEEYNIPADSTRIVVFGFRGGSNTSTARALVTIPPQRENIFPGEMLNLLSPGSPNAQHKFTFIDHRGVHPRVSMGGGFKVKHPASALTGVTTASRSTFDPTVIQVNSYEAVAQPFVIPHNYLFGCGYSGPEESLDSLRREIDNTGDFSVGPVIGVPGEQSLDTPWTYKDYELLEIPMEYWPAKFVTIHLNTLAGDPYIPGNPSERDSRRALIQNSLYEDVLPVHVRVGQWATDQNAPAELIEVTETFSIA